jgi:hypothetical protein
MDRKIQEENWPGIALSVEDCSVNPIEAEVWSIEHLHYPLHALKSCGVHMNVGVLVYSL